MAAGAVGGLAAAFAMNAYQTLVSQATKAISGKPALNQDEDATLQSAKAISRVIFDHELSDDETQWAVPVLHCAVGVGFGAVYGLLADRFPGCTIGMGTAFGTAVWLAGDEIAVPALGFADGPAQTSLSAHANALASHVVYGFVTDLTRKLILCTT